MVVNNEDYVFDYRLGYVRADAPMAGFDVIGEEGSPRILTLGGYTTPAQAREGKTWANRLYELFKKDGKPVQILNGDTDGFTATEELLMFIRDGILLKPELVICLSGFNNFAYKLGFLKEEQREYAAILRDHPFTNPGQIEFYKDITSRFGLGKDVMYYGEENKITAWEYWLMEVDIIHCLCEEFGIRHITFLQPCVFSGYGEFSNETAGYGFSSNELEQFRARFKSMYESAAQGAKTRDYIKDISTLFENVEVYSDACHVKDEHLIKLGDTIYKSIKHIMENQ